MWQNFAHVLRLVTTVRRESLELIQQILCVFRCLMTSWKEIAPSDCKVWSVVHFLTIENNSRFEIHSCLGTAYGEEECNEP